MSYIYDCLARYGNCYALKDRISPSKIIRKLSDYEDSWVPYNPRKNIPREGLSITSLDGGLSGIPDLDSVREYNVKNNLELDEPDFNKKTNVYQFASEWLNPFDGYIGRTHVIKMGPTGMFPPHRDEYSTELVSFRLFVPIAGCNYPNMFFILDNKILYFNHGYAYFINTCKEHTVFTTSGESVFIVANITLSENSVTTVLENLTIS